MPKNFKELLFLTVLMCSMMLSVVGHFLWPYLAVGDISGFITALPLNFLIVEPIFRFILSQFQK